MSSVGVMRAPCFRRQDTIDVFVANRLTEGSRVANKLMQLKPVYDLPAHSAQVLRRPSVGRTCACRCFGSRLCHSAQLSHSDGAPGLCTCVRHEWRRDARSSIRLRLQLQGELPALRRRCRLVALLITVQTAMGSARPPARRRTQT